jgi:hypothetical protein
MPRCPHRIPYALGWDSNPAVRGKKPAINKVRLKNSRSYRTENAARILYKDQPVNVLPADNHSLFLESHDAYKWTAWAEFKLVTCCNYWAINC